MSDTKHYSIYVTGRVQGVFYRQSTKEKAAALGLKGFVKNLENGSVQIEVEGPENQIKNLIEWAKEGPVDADVLQVKANEKEVEGFESFEVRH